MPIIQKLKHIRCFTTQPTAATFYASTPIFYVNAAPHIGHLYSAVIADAICRYQRLRQPGVEVHLCTGTDEHGTKIQQAAARHKVPIAEYCDDISSRYHSVFQQALVANTDFIRTTEQRHRNAVQHFWTTLHSRGHIYSAQYRGWYCVSDETFLTDSQLKVDPVSGERSSLESGHPVEWTEERNYMFGLAKLQDDVLYWLKGHGGACRVRPGKFQKILFDYLNEPLPDVSVSRPANRVHWAIPVPDDATQTVYVWLDALVNYLTSVGYPDESYKTKWPPKVQVIGKDILKFHGIYWPAFLIAAGLEPPEELFVHSHWMVDGEKMSKSKYNFVDPEDAADLCTMEGLRYFLLREGVAHSDGNYNNLKSYHIVNSELADTLGNLLSRACAKSLNPRQIYPRLHPTHLQQILQLDVGKRLQESLQKLEAHCSDHYDNKNFHWVADTVMATLRLANNFFESTRPWELKPVNSKHFSPLSSSPLSTQDAECASSRLETIIAMTMDTLRLCGIVLQPLVPALSGRLLDKLSVPQTERLWGNLSESFAAANWHAAEKQLDGGVDAVLFRRITVQDRILNKASTLTYKQHVEQTQQQKLNRLKKAKTKNNYKNEEEERKAKI